MVWVVAGWLFWLTTQASAATLTLGSGTFDTDNCVQGCAGTFSPGLTPAEPSQPTDPNQIDDFYLFTVTSDDPDVGLNATFSITHTGPLPNPVAFAFIPNTPQTYVEGSETGFSETSSSLTSQTFTFTPDYPLDPGQYFLNVVYVSVAGEYPPSYTGTYSFTTEAGYTGSSTETPLPSAFALFGSVFVGGLALFRRRNNKRPVSAVA
jgi:hypothetical protein